MTTQTETPERPEYGENVLNYEISGLPLLNPADAYYYLIAASWSRLLGLALVGYVAINLFFALLYWLGGDVIANARSGSFADAFFFSIQTFSTIGYGSLGPSSLYADVLVTIESFIGLVSVAVGTGLIFAKFARPSARVAFSDRGVVHERNGVPTFQFRIANERRSELLNVAVRVSVLIEETTAEGDQMRRFHELKLVRSSLPLFALAMVVMHEITEDSPLYGLSAAEFRQKVLLIICAFEGTDTTFLQTVQTRYLYRPRAIRFEERFADMNGRTADGRLLLQHEHLHITRPFEEREEDEDEMEH